jgi:hypothetical protein
MRRPINPIFLGVIIGSLIEFYLLSYKLVVYEMNLTLKTTLLENMAQGVLAPIYFLCFMGLCLYVYLGTIGKFSEPKYLFKVLVVINVAFGVVIWLFSMI